MPTTQLHLHPRHAIAQLDERVFGGFLEHLGRAVYDGLVDPHTAEPRSDVMDALRPLDMTAMRYPGGNFVSGYHWQDGVGPVDQRPTVRELAWQSIEPNRFGTDEFMAVCRNMDWTPMFAVNLGTGTPEEARDWLEYTNASAGTKFADMRVANGHADPYGIKLWCLGNEMDGPWQLGHVPADHYAIRAQQAAKMMRDLDPSTEFVACGSSNITLDSYLEWDRVVLEHLGDYADYLSIHRYVGNFDDDTPNYLAVTESIDRQIEEADAVCRYVAARKKLKKRPYLCFDEWNAWYGATTGDGRGKFAPPLLEQTYTVEDLLIAAGFLMSFVRHADCVKIANIAQIVNVIAPVMTRGDELFKQTIYWPFEMMSRRREGVSLRIHQDGPRFDTKEFKGVSAIDTAAVLSDTQLHVFAANRDIGIRQEVAVDLAGGGLSGIASAEVVGDEDAKAANSFDQPDLVTKQALEGVSVKNGVARFELPPLSFAAVTFNR